MKIVPDSVVVQNEPAESTILQSTNLQGLEDTEEDMNEETGSVFV